MPKRESPDYSHIKRFPFNDPDLRIFASKDENNPPHVGYRRRIKNPETGNWSEVKTYVGRIVGDTYYTRAEFEELFKRGGIPRLNPKTQQIKLRAELSKRKKSAPDGSAVECQAGDSSSQEEPSTTAVAESKKLESEVVETYDERYVGIGPIVWKLVHYLDIYRDLIDSFKNVALVHNLISLLIYDIEQGGLVAKRFDRWANSYFLPGDDLKSRDEVGAALLEIGLNQQAIHDYFEARTKRLSSTDRLAYDSTTASWATKQVGVAKKGHSKNGASEQQINIGVLYSKLNRSVLDVNIYDGNASDQNNFNELLERNQRRFTSDNPIIAGIVDRGYCRTKNIHAAAATGQRYLFAMKFAAKWLNECVQEVLPQLGLPQAGLPGGNGVKGVTIPHLLEGKSLIYVHVFKDTVKAARDESKLIDRLYKAIDAERTHAALNDGSKGILSKYCLKKSNLSAEREIDWDKVNADVSTMGLFCNVTTWKCSARESYETYGDRSNVEKCFEIGKTDLAVDVIRAHSHQGCMARVFIGALAMTVLGQIDWLISRELSIVRKIGAMNENRRLSLSELGVSKADLIEEFKSLRVIREKDGSLRYSEISDRMMRYARIFGKDLLATPPEYCRSNFTAQQISLNKLASDAATGENVAKN